MRVPIKDLRSIVNKLLVVNNLSIDQSEIIADYFIEADACGIASHGVSTLPAHINKLQSKGYNTEPEFNVIREGGAFAVIDGDNAMGVMSAVHCMKYAMKKCKDTGIFTVFSRNSNTYGSAFYYTMLASQSGLIGITFSNSPASMSVCGGSEKLLGTNPFAIAIPCNKEDPIVLDMATSKVAKSKINEARKNNEKIPLDWALNGEGKPTADPLEAIKGFMLPMEGYKGTGIAMLIDILAGTLSGAAYLGNVGKFYSTDGKCMNVGQTFVTIDPAQVYGENFYKLMDKYVETIRSSKSSGSKKPSLPGDNKHRNRRDSIKNGIEMQREIVERLNISLKENGIYDLLIRTENCV